MPIPSLPPVPPLPQPRGFEPTYPLSRRSLEHLLAIAEHIVGRAEEMFSVGLGAAPAVMKPGGDFATEVDLAIESYLRRALLRHTGIDVFGEEAGGNLDADLVWVVDPIDGTSNFAAGNSHCAILVSLLERGQPVIALTSMPVQGRRLSAISGGGVRLNGKACQRLPREHKWTHQIGFGSIVSPMDSRFPTTRRHDLLRSLVDLYPRLRITGSVGVDLAYVAMGIFGAAVTFSPHVWDNAAGVLLVTEAGGTVTDLSGNAWHKGSDGVIAGTSQSHGLIVERVRKQKY